MSSSTFLKFFSRARKTDPTTSQEAAESAKDMARHHMAIIHQTLEQHGPMGKDRIALKAGLRPDQVWRRLSEMEKIGIVKLTGRTVESFSGRKEREWTHL